MERDLAGFAEDDLDEFTGKPYSKWTTRKAEPGETRAVFVDEFTCIGGGPRCKPNSFDLRRLLKGVLVSNSLSA